MVRTRRSKQSSAEGVKVAPKIVISDKEKGKSKKEVESVSKIDSVAEGIIEGQTVGSSSILDHAKEIGASDLPKESLGEKEGKSGAVKVASTKRASRISSRLKEIADQGRFKPSIRTRKVKGSHVSSAEIAKRLMKRMSLKGSGSEEVDVPAEEELVVDVPVGEEVHVTAEPESVPDVVNAAGKDDVPEVSEPAVMKEGTISGVDLIETVSDAVNSEGVNKVAFVEGESVPVAEEENPVVAGDTGVGVETEEDIRKGQEDSSAVDSELEGWFKEVEEAAEAFKVAEKDKSSVAGPSERKKKRTKTTARGYAIDKSGVSKSNSAAVNPETVEVDPTVSQMKSKKRIPDEGGAVKEKKKKSKPSPVVDSHVVLNGVWFHDQRAADRWKLIQERRIVYEGVFVGSKFEVQSVVKMVKKAGLMQSLLVAQPFNEPLVREVVANVSQEFGVEDSPNYGLIRVRGEVVKLSPELINEHLGVEPKEFSHITNWDEIAVTLTGGQVKLWKGATIESKYLSTSYALLHGICIRNWIPLAHRTTISRQVGAVLIYVSKGRRINLGKMVFDQIASHATSIALHHPIAYPSTIYELVIRQCPQLKEGVMIMSPAPKAFVVDWKLFTGKHLVDVTVPKSVDLILQKQGLPSEAAVAGADAAELRVMMIDRLKRQIKFLEDSEAQIKAEKKEVKSLLRTLENVTEDEEAVPEEIESDSAEA